MRAALVAAILLLALGAAVGRKKAAKAKAPGAADVVGEVAKNIEKASERSREIQNEHMKTVNRDPGNLISREALMNLVKGNSFLPQKAGTKSINLQAGQGFNGITNYEPSSWKITETMSGPTEKKEESSAEKEPLYSYPMGLGPVLLNQCTERNYSKTSPCYNSKLFDLQVSICLNMMDAAGYIGVGFDGRGYYSAVSRKTSLVQRVCANKATFLGQDIPDTMNVFGIFQTEAETQSFQSVDQYMRYIRHKAGMSNQKGLFTSEASKYGKASSAGFNLGGIGAMVGAGIGAVAGGPGGAMIGAAAGGAIGGSIEGGIGRGSGKNSGTDKSESSSKVEQRESSSQQQGSAQNFFAIMFVKIVLYELTLDEVKPTDLSLNFLKDYMQLPASYYSVGADVKFQNFLLRWGTHFIRSGKFGGQLKVTKTMKTSKALTSQEFSRVAEDEFMSMFATLQSSYTQKSSSAGFLGIGAKSRSTKQKSEAKAKREHSSSSTAQGQGRQSSRESQFTQTSVEAQGGTSEIAEALMDFYTPAFKQLFHDWIVSIKDNAKPFEFQLKSVHDLFNMRMDELFPAGDVDFGCVGGAKGKVTIMTEPKTGKRFYVDTRVTWTKTKALEEKIKVYCKYSSRDAFERDLDRRRLSLERAIGVYMVEGPFPTSSFELPAGEAGCEEKALTQFDIFSHKRNIMKYSDMKAAPFLLVLNLPQPIPGVTSANAKYEISHSGSMWFATEPGATHANLYEGCEIAADSAKGTKICFRNIIFTYSESSGFFHVEAKDFRFSKLRMPTLPNWLSGTTVARPKPLQTADDVKKDIMSKRVQIPCNVKWLNSHRLDPNKDENCIHFTAATEGDIFVLFASIPKKHHTWYYLQINSEGVSFYRGFELEKRDIKTGMGVLGDRNLFQSYFVCVTQKDRTVSMQYGKADPDSEVGTVYSSYSFPSKSAFSRLSFYSFGSGTRPVSLMDIRLTKQLPEVKCIAGDYIKVKGHCVLVCHKECSGCKAARNSKACQKCNNVRVEHGSGTAKVTECLAECPAGKYESDSQKKLCVSCAAGFFKSKIGNEKCTKCPAGSFSSEGAAACTPCAAGSFNDKVAQSKCQQCAAGTFSGSSGAERCDQCPAGKISVAGKQQCQPCPHGHFAKDKGLTECTPCSAGFFADATGQTECKRCPTGTSSASGSRSCDNNCKKGEFSPEKGVSCRKCPAGSFADSAGSSSCTKCRPGSYQPGSGSAACVVAPKGSFVSAQGATSSQKCPAGKFASAEGLAACVACPAGKFAKDEGAVSCSKCPAGKFASSAGSTSCSGCAALRFSKPGAKGCQLCPALDPFSVSTDCYKKLSFSGCSQSSVFKDAKSSLEMKCKLATDKNLRRGASAACARTKSHSGAEWRGNFATAVSLNSVVLVGRNGKLASESTDVKVDAFDGTSWHACGSVSGLYAFKVLPCRVAKAKAVRVTRLKKGSLSLCEVEAFALSVPDAAINCAAGSAALKSGSATCGRCAAGTYSARAGSATCVYCPVGRFSNAAGSTSCTKCPKGNYQGSIGAASCKKCPKGQYASSTGSTGCKKCPKGQYASSTGSSSCSRCPAGKYASSTGASSCSDCSVKTYSKAGARQCSNCAAFRQGVSNNKCYKKVSFSGCSQSSIWKGKNCHKAMDGRLSRDNDGNPGCAHTDKSKKVKNYWIGNFNREQHILAITILTRDDKHWKESSRINVEYKNTRGSWSRITYIDAVRTKYHVITTNVRTRGIRIRKPDYKGYLTLCEVQAFGVGSKKA